MFCANSVRFDTAIRELSLFSSQPSRPKRIIRQDECSSDGYDKRNCSLKNKEPPPSCKTGQFIHAAEDARSD
jgi:hypothetical protein